MSNFLTKGLLFSMLAITPRGSFEKLAEISVLRINDPIVKNTDALFIVFFFSFDRCKFCCRKILTNFIR